MARQGDYGGGLVIGKVREVRDVRKVREVRQMDEEMNGG